MASLARLPSSRSAPLSAPLYRELAELEPRSTLALVSAAAERTDRYVRVLRARRSLCVIVRRSPGIWVGYPVLVDQTDAAELAHLIDRSMVIGLDGDPQDVDPLVRCISRVGEERRQRRIVVPRDELEWEPPDDSTRLATPLDLPALETLYEGTQVARSVDLRRAVGRMGCVVHDDGAGVDAAVLTLGFTPQHLAWAHLQVVPSARGHARSWSVMARVAAICQAARLGFFATVADDNPMTLPTHLGRVDEVATVDLSMPDRVPGERRTRRAAWRVRAMVEQRRGGSGR